MWPEYLRDVAFGAEPDLLPDYRAGTRWGRSAHKTLDLDLLATAATGRCGAALPTTAHASSRARASLRMAIAGAMRAPC